MIGLRDRVWEGDGEHSAESFLKVFMDKFLGATVALSSERCAGLEEKREGNGEDALLVRES